ncbi:hypothetical protein K378_03722 [Streptomyces sp. Amel2xB2]|nr:hypothetical protein K378_03722 [Streptomyces sp. Amel2xB2]
MHHLRSDSTIASDSTGASGIPDSGAGGAGSASGPG